MKLNRLFLATAAAVALATAANAAGPYCVPEGKPSIAVGPVAVPSTYNTNTKVNPKQDLSIRVKPAASGNTSFTIALTVGGVEVSKSTVGLTPNGDGLNVKYDAPLLFDGFTISATSIGTAPSLTAVQGK